ncbi:hypothetical protein CYMTET_29188 [Cymbomonas tetramitiformis]|uniref:Uncharacterized protein n=1 Tax=Cymbomonas tetramitiformis TaxID=36881 RepID=A0AAE0KV60_9CHLO|nr:hypothetical protein CYMTET_29188 [Cymbomonas tetramitiformis]
MSRSAPFYPSALMRATSANYVARTRRRDSASHSPNNYFGTLRTRLSPRKRPPWDQLQLGEPRFASYKASRNVSVCPLPTPRRMQCARVLAQRQQGGAPAKSRGLRPFKEFSQKLSRAINIPPQPLELAITAGTGIVFGSVLLTLVLPTVITALSITAFAFPLVLTVLGIVALTGVVVGGFMLPLTVGRPFIPWLLLG